MPTSGLSYTSQTRPDDPTLNSLDAKSITVGVDGTTVYTSPNMSFVPEPHNHDEDLRARADGRFGTADCFQWPQLYCDQYRFAVCIRRKEAYAPPDPLSWAWYCPTLEDFEPLTHAAFQVGKLKQEKGNGLASLLAMATQRYKEWKTSHGDKQDIASRWIKSLEHDIMLLLNHPLTFRDIIVYVAQAQRHFLDIYAFLDYVLYVQPLTAYPSGPPASIRSHWMGCFTPDTKICDDLFLAGVPVWLIRPPHTITSRTILERPVKFTFPDNIIRTMFFEQGQSDRHFVLLYRGPGGFARHLHTRCAYAGSVNTSSSLSDPSAPQVTPRTGKAPTHSQTKRAEQKKRSRTQSGSAPPHSAGRNKWEELREPEMPLPFHVWENAVKHVDKDPSRVTRGKVDPGYRVPEPALFLSSLSPDRRKLLMTNWLAIRPLWISRLDHDPPSRFPTPQQWRDILHGVPCREQLEAAGPSQNGRHAAKNRKLAVAKLFGDVVVAMTQVSTLAPTEHVEWRGTCTLISSLLNPPPRFIKAVLWEMYEIGWRYELCALDQALNPDLWVRHRTERLSFLYTVFPGSSGRVLWSEPLPSTGGDLGLTDSFPSNERVLRSFCLLLSTWPDAHPSFSYVQLDEGTKHVQAYEIMSRACLFYVQTFFDHFGRPPLVPHRFPLEYHDP